MGLVSSPTVYTHGHTLWNHGIPLEVSKAWRLAKTGLYSILHRLLLQCWEEGTVPQDNCVTLSSARSTTVKKIVVAETPTAEYSLISIVGKVFAERVCPEAQCDFRAGRSTTRMICSLRQLQKYHEQKHSLYYIHCLLWPDKGFRFGLFALLKRIGCPPRFLGVITLSMKVYEELFSSYDG